MKKLLFFVSVFIFINTGEAQTWAWAKSGDGPGGEGWSVSTDPTGNVFITGYYTGSINFGGNILTPVSSTLFDSYVVKYDASGNVLWARNIGGTQTDQAYSVSADLSGNVFVAGYFNSPTLTIGPYVLNSTGGQNIFLAKYDGNGNVLWANKAVDGYGYANSVTTDMTGNILVTGVQNSKVFVAKYNTLGNPLWAKFSTSVVGLDIGNSVSTDGTGNAYVTGQFNSSVINFGGFSLANNGSQSAFLVKYDVNGNVLWAKGSTGNQSDIGGSVSTDASGNSYITGSFQSNPVSFGSFSLTNSTANFGKNVFVVKYNSAGNVMWAKKTGGSGGGNGDIGYTVSSYGGGAYVVGSIGSPSLTLGSFTLTPTAGSDPAFIANYDLNGSVTYATLLESGGDDMFAITVDQFCNAYITGDFVGVTPFMVGPFALTQTGGENTFTAKLSMACVAPVTITDFNAVAKGGNIDLQWRTEEEFNISAYRVERSVTGTGNFEKLGNITAFNNGTSNNYSFTDRNARPGIKYFYRLAVMENGSIKKYSVIRSAQIPGDDAGLITITNPVHDVAAIYFSGISNVVQVSISDMTGNVLLKKNIVMPREELSLDMSGFAPGNYFISIVNGQTRLVKKLVKL